MIADVSHCCMQEVVIAVSTTLLVALMAGVPFAHAGGGGGGGAGAGAGAAAAGGGGGGCCSRCWCSFCGVVVAHRTAELTVASAEVVLRNGEMRQRFVSNGLCFREVGAWGLQIEGEVASPRASASSLESLPRRSQ